MTAEMDAKALFEILETGDVEICFLDGRTISAHALKLKSLGGFMHNLIEDVVEDQIDSAKRHWTDMEQQWVSHAARPQIKVGMFCSHNNH